MTLQLLADPRSDLLRGIAEVGPTFLEFSRRFRIDFLRLPRRVSFALCFPKAMFKID